MSATKPREGKMNMPYSVVLTDQNSIVTARSSIYKIFARVFSYPDETFSYGDLIDQLATHIACLENCDAYPSMQPLLNLLNDELPQDIDEHYTELFLSGRGGSKISLCENDYSSKSQMQIWESVIRFYEYFELGYNLEETGEPPDHLVVELDFMHFLTFIEAGVQDPAPFLRGQKDFIEIHLGSWLHFLAGTLANTADNAPYGLLADALGKFLASDLAYLTQIS